MLGRRATGSGSCRPAGRLAVRRRRLALRLGRTAAAVTGTRAASASTSRRRARRRARPGDVRCASDAAGPALPERALGSGESQSAKPSPVIRSSSATSSSKYRTRRARAWSDAGRALAAREPAPPAARWPGATPGAARTARSRRPRGQPAEEGRAQARARRSRESCPGGSWRRDPARCPGSAGAVDGPAGVVDDAAVAEHQDPVGIDEAEQVGSCSP